MTQVVKKYKLENIDASKTFDSVEDFFNHSSSVEVDSAKLNAHIENDNANSTGKEGILGDDKKHVIIFVFMHVRFHQKSGVVVARASPV